MECGQKSICAEKLDDKLVFRRLFGPLLQRLSDLDALFVRQDQNISLRKGERQFCLLARELLSTRFDASLGRSNGTNETKLREGGYAVIQPDLFDDLAVLEP